MEERYFVLERFGEVSRTLSSLIEAIPVKRQAVERYKEKRDMIKAKEAYAELETAKNKLLEAVQSAKLLFSETEMAECAAFAGKLYDAIRKFNLLAPDYSKFIGTVAVLQKQIPKPETANASIIGRLMNNVRTGYYPTDIEHIKLMKRALAFPEYRINVFDPCCGCGLALEMLTMDENTVRYGIELDELRAQEAEGRLDRVGYGSFFHSRVSHEAFHLMLLNPPYLSVMTEGGSNARSEKRFLVESMYHLMIGGVLIYIIPYYRLTTDICRILCDNFSEIKVYRFLDSEFKKFNQIAVFGIRKHKEDGSELAQKLADCAMRPEDIPLLNTVDEGSYHITTPEKQVEIFKGAQFNVAELQRQLKASKSIDMLFEKSKLDETQKRPLLPLNIGQIGLIGGSGLINGYVDCDNPHIIKGRIVKENKSYYNETDETITETRVNKMIFNILTPDGFKRLA